MKKNFCYILFSMLTVFLTGCSKSADEDTYLTTDVTTLTFENEGGSQNLSINCNTNWIITASEEWVGVATKQGNGNRQVVISVPNLYNPIQVEGTLSIRTDDGAKTVNVKVKVKGMIDYPGEDDRVLTLTNAANIMNFDGSEHDADSLCFMANVAWEVKGPEWIEAWDGARWRPLSPDRAVVYGKDSQNLPIRTVASYDGEDLIEDEITICERTTGNLMRKMMIFRTGRNLVLTNKVVSLSDGVGFNFKCGNNVSSIYYHVSQRTLNLSNISADEIRNNWKNATLGSGVGVTGLKASTSYNLYLVSEESLNTPNYRAYVFSFHTPSDQNQPEATVSRIWKEGNFWYADATMSDNTLTYIVLGGRDGDDWVKFNNPLLALQMSVWSLRNPEIFTSYLSSGYVPILQDAAGISEVHCATWAMSGDGKVSGTLHHYVRRLDSSAPAMAPVKDQQPLRECATREDFEKFASNIRIIRR